MRVQLAAILLLEDKDGLDSDVAWVRDRDVDGGSAAAGKHPCHGWLLVLGLSLHGVAVHVERGTVWPAWLRQLLIAVGILGILVVDSFLHLFTIYSYCNLHDVSWGNRPGTAKTTEQARARSIVDRAVSSKRQNQTELEEEQEKAKKEKEQAEAKEHILNIYAAFRCRWATVWLVLNIGLAAYITSVYEEQRAREDPDTTQLASQFTVLLFGVVTLLNGTRFLGTLLYLILQFLSFVKRRVCRLTSKAK
mmetsp:Transcript_56120/g.122043  ORF Transcript_56120/g.122043 Transcript_56120/m.122043 type:complete len:249 (-) Transcript_56120:101-847(-)